MQGPVILYLCVLSFLSGVLYGDLGLTLLFSLIPAVVLFAILYAWKVDLRIALFAALLLIAGNFYYQQDEYRYQSAVEALPSSGKIVGIVVADPRYALDYQSFIIETKYGKLSVTSGIDPEYAYGDTLSIDGKIDAPTPYLHGQHILGEIKKPSITIDDRGGGYQILTFLYGLKKTVHSSYTQVLKPDQSALLDGVIFGTAADVSKQFVQDLQLSGLRFIVAIDGLHMQIVILILFVFFASFLPRRSALILTFFMGVAFIAITGFTVSGIRAGLMATLSGLAKYTGRLYLPHNILALAALILTLINPQVLFDVGFQLSFLAVIAIIYVLPVLRGVLHLTGDGFLGWKESLLITLSVQLATAPVVITQFQTFSLTSFIASVALVWMLPFIIMGGFLLAGASFIWYPLASLVSLIVAPLIDYVIFIVHVFARLSILFDPQFGFIGIVVYYGALVTLMYWFYSMRELVPEVKVAMIKEAPYVLQISEEAASYEVIEVE
jgi:competence protein ComEC